MVDMQCICSSYTSGNVEEVQDYILSDRSSQYNADTSINATGMQRICHVYGEMLLGLGKGGRGSLLVCNEPR